MNLRTALGACVAAPLALFLAGCRGDAPKVEPSAAPPATPAAASTTAPPPAAPPGPASPSPAASVATSGGTAAAKLAALDGRAGSEAEYQAILTRLAAKTGGTEDAVAEGAITVHKTTSVSCLQALYQMETGAAAGAGAGTTGAGAAPAPPGPPGSAGQ